MKAIVLGAYTPNALKGLMSGSDRKAAVEAILNEVGATLESIAFTRGEYDVVVTATFPDVTSLIGVATAVKASGAFEKAIYLEELNISVVIDAAKKAAGAYTPAG
tara:strand:- start:753 stop:1067 length:315 start_codon:yes stop_codon:yes gene_type:complete